MSEQGEIFQYKKNGGTFLKARKEFIIISEFDLIDALILRVFEYEIERIRGSHEAQAAHNAVRGQQVEAPTLWVEMPWARLIHKLYLDGHMTENTIKAHVRSIMKRGHLEQRKNPKDPNRKPLQYHLDTEKIQKDIDSIGTDPFFDNASYLHIEGSNIEGSNIEGSNIDTSGGQILIPGGQILTPDLSLSGGQYLTPFKDREDCNNKDKREDITITSALPLRSIDVPTQEESLFPEVRTVPIASSITKKAMRETREQKQAELMVLLVEKRLGYSFPLKVRGNAKDQKSARDRQKEAGLKIIQANVTYEELEKAYDDLNSWWRDHGPRDLTLTDMAVTPKGKTCMRAIEITERLEREALFPQGQRKRPSPTTHETEHHFDVEAFDEEFRRYSKNAPVGAF